MILARSDQVVSDESGLIILRSCVPATCAIIGLEAAVRKEEFEKTSFMSKYEMENSETQSKARRIIPVL